MPNNPNAADNLIAPKKGEVRNPNGKPKGTKHLSTWIRELLNDETFETQIREGLKIVEFKGAPIKAIVKAQMIKAVNGDDKAFDLLGKYGFGTKLQLGNDPDNPLNPVRELTDEELLVRYQQIISSGQGGVISDSPGAGSPQSS